MSYNTFPGNNENKENDPNEGSPYANYGGTPSQGSAPSGDPYGTPANSSSNSPYGGSPYGNGPQDNNYGQQNPYAHQAPPQAQQGGFSIMGLTWQKNIVPNPATNGTAPMNQKSNVVAYLLWFFLGAFGVHQYYLGNNARGLFNLALWGVTTLVSLIGIPFSLIYLVYWIYEAVTLNDQTIEVNRGFLRKSIL